MLNNAYSLIATRLSYIQINTQKTLTGKTGVSRACCLAIHAGQAKSPFRKGATCQGFCQVPCARYALEMSRELADVVDLTDSPGPAETPKHPVKAAKLNGLSVGGRLGTPSQAHQTGPTISGLSSFTSAVSPEEENSAPAKKQMHSRAKRQQLKAQKQAHLDGRRLNLKHQGHSMAESL